MGKNMACRKLFISHSSKDAAFGKALVELLLEIGIKGSQIVFTGDPQYGIPPDENIFDYLKSQINDDAYMLYLISNNYYSSVACLNEMGAAWVKQNHYSLLMIPGFDSGNPCFQKGAADPRKIAAVMDDRVMMKRVIRKIQTDFSLVVDEAEFQSACDRYFEKIDDLKDPYLAFGEAEKALRRNPSSRSYQDMGIQIYRTEGRLSPAAIQNMLYAIYLDPDNCSAYYQLISMSEVEETNHAMRLAEDACRRFPKIAQSYGWRAKMRWIKREYDEAIADATRSLSIERLAWVLITRGRCYLDQGKSEPALSDFWEVCKSAKACGNAADSSDAADFMRESAIQIGLGQVQDAASTHKDKASSLRSEWKEHRNEAAHDEAQRHSDEAEKYFTCLLAADPENKYALQEYGGLCYNFEQFDKAFAYWGKLVKLEQTDYYYWLCALALQGTRDKKRRNEYCRQGLLCPDRGYHQNLRELMQR